MFQVTAPLVWHALQDIFRHVPSSHRHTLTCDRGKEFGEQDAHLEALTQMRVYRAHPYHSWERGCNENWNGLLRKYFPKGTDFATITPECLEHVVDKLNHRPRKRLNYLTPYEVFVLGLDPNVASQT
jgi:IS30 family transposase